MSDRDVIVLGAGVIGAAIAFELSAAGYRVRVIEARAPGQGATQASAGVLAPYIEGHESAALSALGRRSLDIYDDFVARAARASGRSIAYARIGTIEVALDAAHAARLRQSAPSLAAAGVEARWLEPTEVWRSEPAIAATATGALVLPVHGFVGATDLTQALIAAATDQGAIVEQGTRARGLERIGNSLLVDTDAGRWAAAHVVLAAGSWSGQIAVAGTGAAPVHPVRGQLLVLRQHGQVLRHVVWGRDCYLVPWSDGTVLVGATMEDVGFDEGATVHGVDGLLRAAQALVPALREAAFEGVRVGLRPSGPDELPMIGLSARVPGLVYASGHFRNGVLLAPITAALVRGIVDGRAADPALASVDPARVGL